MFDLVRTDLAQQMRGSENYKLIRQSGWLYVFPDSADFKALAERQNSVIWEQMAVIIINDEGEVVKSRYGKVGVIEW